MHYNVMQKQPSELIEVYMSGKTEQLSIRLDASMMAVVNSEAEKQDVSAAHIVRDALKEKYPSSGASKIDLREAFEDGERRRAALAKRFVVDDEGYMIIDGWYEIEMTRCDTYDKILSWVLHLSEKNWASDPAFIRSFVQLCLRHAGLGFPQA